MRGAGGEVGSLPLLPTLKRLRSIHDVVIVVVVAIVIMTDGMMGWWLRVTVVDDADGLTSGGMMVRVTVLVDGGRTKGWFGIVNYGYGVGVGDGVMSVK